MVQDGRLSPKLAAEVILLMQETGKPLEAVMAEGDGLTEDPEGTELPDPEAVRIDALASAQALLALRHYHLPLTALAIPVGLQRPFRQPGHCRPTAGLLGQMALAAGGPGMVPFLHDRYPSPRRRPGPRP